MDEQSPWKCILVVEVLLAVTLCFCECVDVSLTKTTLCCPQAL